MLPKNYHLGKEEWINFLQQIGVFMNDTCVDCGVELFQRHKGNCDVPACSVCGTQRLTCTCETDYNAWFSGWRGYWPGRLEKYLFNLSTEQLILASKFFFINPMGLKLKNLLVVFDQDQTAPYKDTNFMIQRANVQDLVITTAIMSADDKANKKIIRDIKNNLPMYLVSYSGNPEINEMQNIP